ncbi:HAD-like domain-containing protein [Cladochytrium replicatum]|nr:HAD-like domain-containing protein [Cladochytrium replicatum]
MSLLRVVASDIDGTLLPLNHTQLSAKTVEVLQNLLRNHTCVVLATGRPRRALVPLISQLQNTCSNLGPDTLLYCVMMNGAVAVDPLRDAILLREQISHDVLVTFVRHLRAVHDVNPITLPDGAEAHWPNVKPRLIFGGDNYDAGFHCEPDWYTVRKEFMKHNYNLVDDIVDLPVQLEKLVVLHPNHCFDAKIVYDWIVAALDWPVATLQGEAGIAWNEGMKSRLQITYSNPWFVEISAGHVSKGHTLPKVLEKVRNNVGAAPVKPEEIAAFGDMPNDVEMLQYAKGYTMVPLEAHADVKKIAMVVAEAGPEDDVVPKKLEELLNAGRIGPLKA